MKEKKLLNYLAKRNREIKNVFKTEIVEKKGK